MKYIAILVVLTKLKILLLVALVLLAVKMVGVRAEDTTTVSRIKAVATICDKPGHMQNVYNTDDGECEEWTNTIMLETGVFDDCELYKKSFAAKAKKDKKFLVRFKCYPLE